MSLTLLATLTSVQLVNVTSSHRTIFADFQELLEVQTFVLYDYHNQGPLLDYLPDVVRNTPHLVITQEVVWKLKEYFGEHSLSVVYVRAKGNEEILRILYQSMHRWHLKYVLFITSESLEPWAKWWPLFLWCHVNGFFNSLLMDVFGSLLAYDHFESQQVFRTSLQDFLEYRQDFSNAHGFPIRATLGNNPPRALIYYDSQDSLQLSGYYGKLLTLFAQHYNASLEFVIISQLDYYNELECLDYIAHNKADLCGDAMIMSPDYITTYAEEITHSFLLVPYDKPLERFYYFLKPLQPEVWLWALTCLLYKALTLSFIQRLQGGTWDLSLNALKSLQSVLNIAFQLNRMRGWRRKFVEFIMILMGFVVANWYLSILSSVLFSRLYTDYINSLEDLVAHNISIMISEVEQFALNASDISPLISQQLLVVDNKELLYHRRNLIPSYAYYSQYDKNTLYLHQQKFMQRPRMKELTREPINSLYAGMPMRSNWPLEDMLNRHMRYMVDSGIYMRFFSDTTEEAVRLGHLKYFPTEHHYAEPLSLEHFQMATVLLACGYVLAMLSFSVEIVVDKYKKKYK